MPPRGFRAGKHWSGPGYPPVNMLPYVNVTHVFHIWISGWIPSDVSLEVD